MEKEYAGKYLLPDLIQFLWCANVGDLSSSAFLIPSLYPYQL